LVSIPLAHLLKADVQDAELDVDTPIRTSAAAVGFPARQIYFRSIFPRNPNTTALATPSSSGSISSSPKVRVSGCPQNSPILAAPVEFGEA
jgi:hypothetical protein